VSSPVGRCCLHPTLPESWYLLYHPKEGRRLSWPRHTGCGKLAYNHYTWFTLTARPLQFSYCIDEQDILSDLMIINKVCGGKSLTKTLQSSAPSLNHSGDIIHDVSVEDGRLCYEKRWQVLSDAFLCSSKSWYSSELPICPWKFWNCLFYFSSPGKSLEKQGPWKYLNQFLKVLRYVLHITRASYITVISKCLIIL